MYGFRMEADSGWIGRRLRGDLDLRSPIGLVGRKISGCGTRVGEIGFWRPQQVLVRGRFHHERNWKHHIEASSLSGATQESSMAHFCLSHFLSMAS